jgi:hypothetical protein
MCVWLAGPLQLPRTVGDNGHIRTNNYLLGVCETIEPPGLCTCISRASGLTPCADVLAHTRIIGWTPGIWDYKIRSLGETTRFRVVLPDITRPLPKTSMRSANIPGTLGLPIRANNYLGNKSHIRTNNYLLRVCETIGPDQVTGIVAGCAVMFLMQCHSGVSGNYSPSLSSVS